MGAGASLSVDHTGDILDKLKTLKRVKDRIKAVTMLRSVASKSSVNRLRMCETTDVLKVLGVMCKANTLSAAESMRVIAVIAQEVDLADQILDTAELAIVHALSSDNAKAWADIHSKESWALLALVRLLRSPSATARLIGNGISDVVRPLLDLDANDAPVASLDMIIVTTTLFMGNEGAPETELNVAFSTLALIVEAIGCITKNIDGTLFRLGRYQLSQLLELVTMLAEFDDSIRKRIVNEHFTIVRVLMHVLQNFMEGNPGNKSGGGLEDEGAVRLCFNLLTLLLEKEIQEDEELGMRLQAYGLGAIACEICDREAPTEESTMLLRLKNWGKGSAVLPKPASTLKREILPHNTTVLVYPPPAPYRKKKGQKKKKNLPSEILRAHEYYKLVDGRGYLLIKSEDHCFVKIAACSEDTKAAAQRLIQILPMQDSFGSASLVTTAASGRTSRAALTAPTLDRRDGIKDAFTLDYDSDEDDDDRLVSLRGHSKHILLSYAKGCENEGNVKHLARCLRQMKYRVYCDDGSVGHKMDPRKEEAMDAAPLIVIVVSKKYHETCREEAAYARVLQAWGKTQLVYFMTNENYHTDSHPFRVSGWLGNMLTKGGVVWFPGWTKFQATGSADEIHSIVQRTVDMKTASLMKSGET